jgi:hypothetical protein
VRRTDAAALTDARAFAEMKLSQNFELIENPGSWFRIDE